MRPPFLLVLLLSIAASAQSAAARPPNVVIIMADDMNDYGFLGAHPDALTPRLDAFRREALTFPRTYCPAPACVPSRVAFFTGLNPHRTGAYLNGSDPWDKPGFDRYVSMPELFRRRGYATWGGGKVFHAKITEARRSAAWTVDAGANGGFGPHVLPADQIDGQWWGATAWTGPDTDFPDVRTLTQAREFLARHEDGKPFFMFVGLWRPHTPFTAPKRFFDLYDPARLRLPPAGWRHGDLDDVPPEGQRLAGVWGQRWTTSGVDHPEAWRRILHGYLACTSFADWAIGEVLDGLRQRADYANTLVIVTTDNGYHLGEKDHFEKSTLWEASARTPLAVRLPGGRHAGQISPRVIGLIDVLPTLAQLCELPAPGHAYDGRTLAPLLEDPSSPWSYPAFTAHRDRSAAWRDERWRYIRYPDDTEELYDHTVDPHEWHNLALSPAHHDVLQRFRTLWPEAWAPSLGGRDG